MQEVEQRREQLPRHEVHEEKPRKKTAKNIWLPKTWFPSPGLVTRFWKLQLPVSGRWSFGTSQCDIENPEPVVFLILIKFFFGLTPVTIQATLGTQLP